MISVPCNFDLDYRFDPDHTALVVIDMQRDFLEPGGMVDSLGEDIGPLRAIVAPVRKVLATARGAGLAVLHTREGYAPDLSDIHPLKRERYTAGREGPMGRFLIRGEHGQDIIDELAPRPGEPVLDKPGFGAFFRTDLQEHLEALGISHLLLCGITTQCCVQSTLREAVDRGYRCLTLEDCCAAIDPALHAAAISLIYGENHLFGWVSDSARLLSAVDTVSAA